MGQTAESRWTGYYNAQHNRALRPIFVDALAHFAASSLVTQPRQAIDLGCGDGTETLALLENNWQVLAIDQQAEAIRRVQAKVPVNYQTRLETRVGAFEELILPPADFIYAGYSLPFCAPTHFASLWAKIVTALPIGGRFAGQLFGNHDSWTSDPTMNFHTAEQAKQRFGQFELESWQEVEEDGNAFSGPKHWHIFHIIARKTAS
ncbi:MAG: class I SAM-dependent methyltransferase [Chloroflexi bacterium]|nr:class I SAM-dependent methyltransferase [Chloroflexota bacterium]